MTSTNLPAGIEPMRPESYMDPLLAGAVDYQRARNRQISGDWMREQLVRCRHEIEINAARRDMLLRLEADLIALLERIDQ